MKLNLKFRCRVTIKNPTKSLETNALYCSFLIYNKLIQPGNTEAICVLRKTTDQNDINA